LVYKTYTHAHMRAPRARTHTYIYIYIYMYLYDISMNNYENYCWHKRRCVCIYLCI